VARLGGGERIPLIYYRSPATTEYNCIAWAAGEIARWWWPDGMNEYYWPAGAPREETLAAFIAAYSSLGYAPCANADLEEGHEKVALYVGPAGGPTHAARQLASGLWTSKLGCMEDVEHDSTGEISALGANPIYHYGEVGAILRRRAAETTAPPPTE